MTQLAIFDFNLILKNYFLKIFKEISFSLYNLYDSFIKQELESQYSDIIKNNLRHDFKQNYIRVINDHRPHGGNKNRDILRILINNIEKSVNSLKFYSSSNLKYSLIKPYGDSLNQLLFSFDRKTLCQFVDVFLNTILYGELESNKKKIFQKNENNISSNNINNINNGIISNNDIGSSIVNNIKEIPPYLPQISPKYKYTLVLDIDETLIHFFFTYINGMFFVRPYVFDFLNEINKYYEIVTFTAGTKEYADNILNLLDINNNLIKYRLYRQHTTILGCNVFKDLAKLGRDLNKIIIIDNLKDNFKLNPNNGLFIKTWTSDVNDNQFYDLEKILKDIVLLDVKDVRPVIEKINDDIKISRNIINPYENIDIKKILATINNNQ
jgi:Dullard-like phosphatase family protein